ncbi:MULTISPECIES: alkaline phosphatase [unclassified Modicisalibacter]|uniref:alkaline phosphatase n=1 Tax=unclassified Modicisalibacter TaxID=2679913 RepID=UPI001CCAA696|nr:MULTISPECIES: alkaline phosphatase [unclassified Modicisalibacter]MBZ9557726.1 alkaline phosphatase [Modicisalibacter sp. R2A 31.J]MBZ9573610.1 alkaline phosphatase [Modicisalibacter sp. MOD 31.J]
MYHNLLILFVINLLLASLTFLTHSMAGHGWLALEAPWLLLALALPSRGTRRRLAPWLAGVLSLLVLLAILDALARLSLGRAFNPLLDTSLARPAYHLMIDNVGKFLTVTGLVVAAALWLMLTWGLTRLLAGARPLPVAARHRAAIALMLVPLGAGLAPLTAPAPLATPALTLIERHWQQWRETHDTLSDFRRRLAERAAPARALPGLAGHDVALTFIESYGVSALFDPRYAPVLQPRLERLRRDFAAAGLHVASARLTAPVQGGQSWLAHGSVISGLWLTSQRHYDLLLAQGAPTLVDDFRLTGQRSVAIMPAITAPWPAGRRLGYDAILDARNIPYQGPALNWVTMPDQYTWRFFADYRERQARPLFAELAMISSHAPWTPILPLLDDWDGLAGGGRFAPWADAGPSPEVLWQDPERVRHHYIRAIDYALAAMGGFAERYLGKEALLIVLGDHQPAPLITGEDASRDVPVHVISADPTLIRPFIAAGFKPGLMPPSGPARWRQAAFRGLLHRLFGAHRGAATPGSQ